MCLFDLTKIQISNTAWIFFDAVATDGQCEILGKSGLGNTELQNVSNDIANYFMDQLYTWEGNVTRDKNKKGYTGVGNRVSKLNMKFQGQYGSKSTKNT